MVARPKGLSRRLQRFFEPAIVARGASYVDRRRVEIRESSARAVAAVVRGRDQEYSVTLTVESYRSSSRIVGACTCSSFERDLCKHLWATLQLAEEGGHLADGNKATSFVAADLPMRRAENALSSGIDDVDDDDDDDDDVPPYSSARGRLNARSLPSTPWRQVIAEAAARGLPVPAALDRHHKTERSFVIDLQRSRTEVRGLLVDIRERSVGPETSGPWKRANLTRHEVDRIEDGSERALIRLLIAENYHHAYYDARTTLGSSITAPLAIAWDHVLPALAETGRCTVRPSRGEADLPLVVDTGEPYRLVLVAKELNRGPKVRATRKGKLRVATALSLSGELRRGTERIPLAALSVIFDAGFAFLRERAFRVESDASFAWIAALRQSGTIEIPAADADDFLRGIVQTCGAESLELPSSLTASSPSRSLLVRVNVKTPASARWAAGSPLEADVVFDYGDLAQAGYRDPGDFVFSPDERRLVPRDRAAETSALDLLAAAGFKLARGEPGTLHIAAAQLPQALLLLPADRFVVEADGVVQRRYSKASFSVSSGIDWFDLEAHVDFDGVSAAVPALLEAARKGQRSVRLADGTVGLLPDEWLARLRRLVGLANESANVKGGRPIRFGKAQVGLVEAMLADDREAIVWDGPITALRSQLDSLDHLKPASAPSNFVGELRPYQREGLAWLQWLESVGLAGCLADDMGLGKTIQVLALLAARSANKPKGPQRPSLVVAPRSVVFNWLDEARRFTPELRVLEFRPTMSRAEIETADVLVATYGLLRQGGTLIEIEYDYVILDEAHAIKNPAAATTAAARLLRSRHRIALTGTPVENHLGELASLFDFLTPGLLGHSLRETSKRSLDLDADAAARLGRGLRPFLLRRKKSEVLTDLPPRIEQTIHCVMGPAQRAIYDEVRTHYQSSLLARVKRDGVGRSAVHVLEALLRLRQIACHPGLVDPARRTEPSAKLEVLLEQLAPVVEQGKKALVFSQFTSLLDIVQTELESRQIAFERLDGKTKDRKARVERFQTDAACGVFLVSLKAGGLGLNLTAAEYVFLLDPWWNPAAEAQAIDRAHRMGQTRSVVSYRLLCADTVEDRIALLQERKRALVASVFAEAGKAGLGSLTFEDVEALLS